MLENRENTSRRYTFVTLMLLWMLVMPFVVIGLAFGGFEALSPYALVSDLALLPESVQRVTGRLLLWLYVLAPILLYHFILQERKQKGE